MCRIFRILVVMVQYDSMLYTILPVYEHSGQTSDNII